MNSGDVEDFNRWSGTYEESWLQRFFFDRIHDRVLGFARVRSAPLCILDGGCGTGRLLRKIRGCYPDARLIGVDPAEGMIKKARQKMPDARFIVGAAEALPLPESSFDLVFSTISFHHWSDQVQGVREIRRVLRPGGQFLLADVVLPPLLVKIIRHGRVRHPAEIREMFRQAGLEVLMQRRLLLGHVLAICGIRR